MLMNLSGLRVIVIDDNRHAVEIIRSVLRALGMRHVSHAVTEASGFRMHCLENFDFAIIDQNLGRGDEGLDLVRRLRTDPDSPNPFVPILMLTAYSERRRVLAARDSGITEFLVKPFTATELARRLQSLLCRPRAFVRSGNYFGPDRRRLVNRRYDGPEQRRMTD